MRIVHYYPRALVGDGGMTGAVRRLSNALHHAGAEAVIVYDEGPDPPQEGAVRWLPVPHVGVTRRVPRRAPLVEAIGGADLMVLNSAWAPHNAIAARVARTLDVPYVVAPRGAYEQAIFGRRRALKAAWWAAVEGPMVRRARAMHLFFDAERHILERLHFRGGVIVAPNGVEPPAGFEWDGGNGGYVLWIGRYDPQHKGIDLLVQAMARVPPARRPPLRLHGPDYRGGKSRVVELVRELALERWVSVGRAVYGDEKWQTLSRAAGFVYPSRWEGFGNAVAEAAAIGVPVVCTPYYLGRFLADRDGAFLAAPTAESLAEAISQLDTARAREVGRNAREIVAQEIAWDQVGKSWLAQAEALF
jgi:glycosyltransferase involved in cell wall biosynthesis